MENTKRTQMVVGKVVNALAKLMNKHPGLWKDENWDESYGLVEAIAELITLVAGGSDPNSVIENIMVKCGRKK